MSKNQNRLSVCISFSFVLCSLFAPELAGSECPNKNIGSGSQEGLIRAVHAAAECHDSERLRSLLSQADAGNTALVDSFIDGYTPLMRACFKQPMLSESRVLATVSALLERGAQVELGGPNNRNSLIYALQTGHGPRVIAVLANKAGDSLDDQDSSGRTAVDYAMESPELLSILKKAGANIPLEVSNDLFHKMKKRSVAQNALH